MKMVRLLLLVCIGFAFTLRPAAEVKLEYVFKVGDEYLWTQQTKQTIKQSIMGMEQNTETAYDGEFALKVAALTATGAKLEMQFLKLRNTAKSAAGEMLMDSEGAADKMENKILKAMMNKPFFVYLDKRGVVEKIEGADNLWSGFKDLGLDENTASTMKQSMEQWLGESSLKGNFEQAFTAYPDKKVKPGDTWTVKTGAPMNFPLESQNTWSLVGVSGSMANLTADGTFVTTDKDKVMSLPGGFKTKVDLAGKQAMKTHIDVKTGWPSDLGVLSELKGKMTLLAGGMIPEDMDIPMEILTETSFKITKK